MSDGLEKVALENEIAPGGRRTIKIGDEVPALVLRAGDDFYCVEDVCTHDGQPMTDGEFEGCELTCPRHGAKFNVKTGAPTKMPATEPVRTFPVEVRDGAVYVKYDG